MSHPRRHTSCARQRGSRIAGLALLTFLLGSTTLSYAQDTSAAAPTREDRLRAIAAQFGDKVGGGLNDVDAALTRGTVYDAKSRAAFEGIPDGEILFLSTHLREGGKRIGAKFIPQDPISAYKQGQTAYISLSDFVYIASFAIRINPETQIASGTSYNQDRTFALDMNARTITIDGETTSLEDDDIITANEDFYIKPEVLEKWFNLRARVLPNSQLLELTTFEQFPLQGRIERRSKRNSLSRRSPKAEKPRLPEQYQVLTTPRADVLIGNQWEKRGDNSPPNNFSTYNISAHNQVFNHELNSFVSGTTITNREGRHLFEQARFNFRKESENNDLLGPLKAKVYEFNDLTPANVPLTSNVGTERGILVSNNNGRFTSDTETVIEGNGQPGWDVELYRNNSYIAGAVVDDTGRYTFERVSLFAGDNRIKIVQFGLEGEKREEERLITVLPNLVGSIKGYYNLSLTQNDTITYRADAPEDDDTGTMRFAGVYDRRVGDNLTLRGGLHSRQTDGQRDNYFYSGAVTSIGEAILNADLVTTSDGPFRSVITARQRLGKHNLAGGLDYRSEDFSDFKIDDGTNVPQQERVYVQLQGPWLEKLLSKTTYDATAGITNRDNGQRILNGEFGLTSRYMGLGFNNQLRYTSDNMAASGEDQIVIYDGSVRGNLKGYNWRGRLGYEVIPDAEPISANVNVSRTFDSRMRGFVDLDHRFVSELTSATVGMTYFGDKARLTPQVSYDSESNLQARLNVNFSLAKDPYSSDVIMSGSAIGTKGGLSIVAFLDKNANGVQEEGEEPLPDVTISAPQFNVMLTTNEEGTAFSYNIPAYKISDVLMEESNAFDPTWVPGFEGVSVRIRPTEVVRIEFPVLRGAEIDGTAYVRRSSGSTIPARSLNIDLVTPDGEIAKTSSTPSDGFYVISAIRPGVYYMVTDSSMSPGDAYRVPEKIVVTPEGAQIYGKNLTLTGGYNIPFTFNAFNANPAEARRTKVLKPEDIAREDVYIRLGNYRSSIAASLDWYKLKLRTRSWANKLVPVAKDFNTIVREDKSGRMPLILAPSKPLRIEEAAQLCERLVDAGFKDCGVDVMTTYVSGSEAVDNSPAPAPASKG